MSGSNASSPPPTERASWFIGLPKWIAGTLALIGLLFIPAGILELLISGTYVPSHEWLEASRPAVYALWMVWGVAVFVILVRSNTDVSKGAVYAVVAIALFFAPVGNLVRTSIPALMAKAYGEDVQHEYKVVRTNGFGGKRCRTPVELEDLPFMTKLCDVGNEFRAKLSPGQTVTFGGKGTWMGLYVEYIQP